MIGNDPRDTGLDGPQNKLERALRLISDAMKELRDQDHIYQGLSEGHRTVRRNLRQVDTLLHAPKGDR